ncbi:MAG: A24 family peptidase [bacterium]|nr:A24 family peptidase [bacterium]
MVFTFLVVWLSGLVVGRFLMVPIRAEMESRPLRGVWGARPLCDCPARRTDLLPLLFQGWSRALGCDTCPEPSRLGRPVYILVELITAFAWAATAWLLEGQWVLVAYLWLVSLTVVLGTVDLFSYRLPNRILIPGTALGMVLLAGGAGLDGRPTDLVGAIATGLGYFLAWLIPALLTGGGIGMGDVKLAFLLGLFAGYQGWRTVITAAFGALLLAGGVALVLMALRRITRRDHLPFGPFMVAGTWLAIAMTLAEGLP